MIKTISALSACFGILTAIGPMTTSPSPSQDSERSTDEFAIDGGHSSVVFRVMHLSASAFWGRFNKVSGSFKVDDENLGDSFIKVEVPTTSIDTNSEDRDRHLKSQDFFSAKEFPSLTFESTKIEKAGDNDYMVTGDLTLRGKTKEVTFSAHHNGTATVSERFGLRCGYEAEIEIDRTDFGISYGTGGVLGETVKLVISVEGMIPK